MIAQSRNDANEISKCASYNIMHISIKKKNLQAFRYFRQLLYTYKLNSDNRTIPDTTVVFLQNKSVVSIYELLLISCPQIYSETVPGALRKRRVDSQTRSQSWSWVATRGSGTTWRFDF